MYRLLIVTENQNVIDMFASMDGWEAIGFKAPRLRSSVDEAVECMHKHAIDAIAVDQSPTVEGINAYLDQNYPDMPIFPIEETVEKQWETVRDMFGLLSRLNADDSNDIYDPAYRLAKQRDRWMKKLLSGMIPTVDEIGKQMRMYRCEEQMDVPCMLARLSLQAGDSFLAERWHYGSERLEIALRNFFGTRHDHMLLHVAVISQEEVRVLCYPTEVNDGLSENATYDYIQETVDQIDHYLGLPMKVLDVRRVPGIRTFATELYQD